MSYLLFRCQIQRHGGIAWKLLRLAGHANGVNLLRYLLNVRHCHQLIAISVEMVGHYFNAEIVFADNILCVATV